MEQSFDDSSLPGVAATPHAANRTTLAAWSASHELAWRLADALPRALPLNVKNTIFIELGCRNYHHAITESLRAVVNAEEVLPRMLVADLRVWQATFRDAPEHDCISALLTRTERRGVLDRRDRPGRRRDISGLQHRAYPPPHV